MNTLPRSMLDVRVLLTIALVARKKGKATHGQRPDDGDGYSWCQDCHYQVPHSENATLNPKP